MEIKKKRYLGGICVLICLLASGCETKYWWDYECAWVSAEPYIYISTSNMANSHYSELELDGEVVVVHTSWYNNGTGIEFCKELELEDDGYSEEDIIWETSVEIIDDVMYLTVDVDNYGDNEGKTFILEQAEDENTELGSVK